MATDRSGKKDRSKFQFEIENESKTFRYKFGEESYISIYQGNGMNEFYRTIKNIKIREEI